LAKLPLPVLTLPQIVNKEIVNQLTKLSKCIMISGVKGNKVKITANEAEKAMLRLMRVGDRVRRKSDERFAHWGLMDSHYNVLRILNGADEPLHQTEIGRRLLSSRANVTKLIDFLEERRFVRRVTCADRRAYHIELTAEGAQFLQDSCAEVMRFAEEMMKSLTKSEQKTLCDLLGKLLQEQ
jgi:MarR family 2-MHQ and catechol resistance regulon transcriptional repressor